MGILFLCNIRVGGLKNGRLSHFLYCMMECANKKNNFSCLAQYKRLTHPTTPSCLGQVKTTSLFFFPLVSLCSLLSLLLASTQNKTREYTNSNT